MRVFGPTDIDSPIPLQEADDSHPVLLIPVQSYVNINSRAPTLKLNIPIYTEQTIGIQTRGITGDNDNDLTCTEIYSTLTIRCLMQRPLALEFSNPHHMTPAHLSLDMTGPVGQAVDPQPVIQSAHPPREISATIQPEEYTAPSEEGLANTTEERATPRIHPITILITLLTLPLQVVALILWCLYYVFTTIHIFTRYRLRTIKAKKRMLRYLQSGSSEDVDAAISYYQHAFIVVHTVEWGRSHSTFALYNLAICLSKRYEQRHNLQDVDEAITYCRVALVICPSVDLDYHFEILNTLGGVLKKRYEESGDISELQEAIIRNVEALSLRPHGHSDRPLSLINLSSCFEAHYNHTGDPTGLERAIECGQEALECPPGRVDVCTILSQVASCLSSRYHRTAALQDLEDAIQYYRKVLELEPIGHPQYPVSKGNLGVSLAARYERLGDERDMEEATDCAREVLNLLPAVHPARRMALSNFASCLLAQVWKQYNENDLEEAIHLLHESLSLGTPDSTTLSHLIACLLTRYDQKGNREDMEEAMRVSRQALVCRPLGPTDRPEALRNLVSCLIARFSQENNPEDISEAIKHITEAIDLVPEGSPDAWKALSQLGSCFRVDSMRTGWEISHPEQLDKAIDLHRRALALLSPEQPFRAVALVDYANCLFVRYLKSEDPQELEEVITNCREACRLLPATSSRLHMEAELLLSASLHSRYELFSNIKDLDEAVSAMESGYPGEATSHPALADRMSLLAQLYITVSGLSGQGSRYDDAMQLFQRGVEHSSASVLSRLRIATIWTIHASGTWQLYAYQKALELANRYLLITPAITSRLNMLQSIPPSLVQNAVACALSAGDCKLAIELLEQGRTLLWSQLSRYRAPLEDLEVGNPDLAASFLALSQQLETSAIRSRSGTIGTSGIHHPIEDDAKRYRELSEAWEATLKQIRSLEGFETFLRPTPFSVLQRAASHGPVIITKHQH
ncbi:hypothetical protein FRC03_007271 [Tulasnella sp. 419]|nr:hypothetical protein FRC03_007271 [Tulasnella sp. 419]